MKCLIYLSTATRPMTEFDLSSLLLFARERNYKHNITGLLLYSGGTFLQVLEGMDYDIDLIFKSVERDNRHKNIIKLIEESLKTRNFPDWSMGFTSIKPEIYSYMEGYLTDIEKITLDGKSDSVVSVLKTFITTNNLVINA